VVCLVRNLVSGSFEMLARMASRMGQGVFDSEGVVLLKVAGVALCVLPRSPKGAERVELSVGGL